MFETSFNLVVIWGKTEVNMAHQRGVKITFFLYNSFIVFFDLFQNILS